LDSDDVLRREGVPSIKIRKIGNAALRKKLRGG
jgi:hypothetical protein